MNVKPGDLAVTTHSKIPGNTGRIVEVVRFHGKDEYGVRWWVRSAGCPMKNGDNKEQFEGHFPDAYLKRVSGLPDCDVENEKITDEVLA